VRLVGCYDGEKYRAFRSVGEFLKAELTRRNNGRWYYAHAGGLFDVQFVLEWILKHGLDQYSVSAAMSGSAAIIVKVERGPLHWYFVDSFWLMRTSLRKIGAWLGMRKGGEEGGTDIFWGPIAELIPYNEQDCKILWHAVAQLEGIVLSLGGELQKTAASTAMNLFRRAYMSTEIITDPTVNEIGRAAYVASRVETFAATAEDAWSWDINSSFPYAMTFPAPGSLLTENASTSDSGLYIADAEVYQPETQIPVLPVRHPKEGRVYFPTGRWRAFYTNTDLQYLEESGGRVERVHRVLHFAECRDFAQYARDLYQKRVESDDDGFKQILKILLNSLYGKTSESGRKSQLVINPPEKILALPDYTPGGTGKRFLRPGVWDIVEEKEVPHAHLPIAATITAIARRTLGRYLQRASTVYYCDTDSLVVPRSQTYDSSSELGGLKLEKSMIKAHFKGPKLYAWQPEHDEPWAVKAKGFSRISTPEGDNRPFAADDYFQLMRGEPVKLSQFGRVRELVGKMNPAPTERVVEKRLIGNLRPKRCPRSDGSSRPWTVEELAGAWASDHDDGEG
jgi:hypothetical protein